MKKVIFPAIILIAFLILTGLSGCKKEVVTGPQKASVKTVEAGKYEKFTTVAGTPKIVIQQARKSAIDTITAYFETAFLDLSLARTAQYKEKISSFFSNEIQQKAIKDYQVLSLGEESKKLSAIVKNSLQIPTITINYDKSKKPSLGTIKVNFKAKYKAGYKNVNLKTSGWFVLARDSRGWKIFDYSIKQNLN
jgi:hypothetical protein